jgi:hypothetical protein
MEKIGFIGLGRMGRPMASNLIKKGFELIVHDVNAEAVDVLVNLGADAGTSVADVAARADVIITMLPNSAIVAQVVSGTDGVLSAARKGALVLDMSTIDPNTTDAIAADCKAHGIGFVDAPVGRLASHADIGQSLFMVGGEEADFERVKPMLDAMGSTIYHCGPCGAAPTVARPPCAASRLEQFRPAMNGATPDNAQVIVGTANRYPCLISTSASAAVAPSGVVISGLMSTDSTAPSPSNSATPRAA